MAYDYDLFKGSSIWELAKATRDNDLRKMEKLSTLEIINEREKEFGQTLLFLSIWNKQVDACEKLLTLGADPNIHDSGNNKTPLIMAADIDDPEVSFMLVRLLLKYGADPNLVQCDSTDMKRRPPSSKPRNATALTRACADVSEKRNPVPTVKLLVEAGADVNYKGNYNVSPLKEALFLNNYDVALYLLEKGADYNQILWEYNKYQDGEPTYILDFLRQELFDLNSKEYEYKMKIVDFLKTKGLDYWNYPIHPDMIKEIKKIYPNNWEEYLEKY